MRRRRRVQLIRKRIVGGAMALFVAVFGGITAQLAAGNDPALSSKATATSTARSSTATATTQQKQATTLTPVTTKQS